MPTTHGAPFLWRVQKGDGPVLWLYGTLHDAGLDAVPRPALAALDGSSTFVSELGDVKADADEVRGIIRRAHGPGIDQELGESDWFDLHDALKKLISEDDLRRVRPWYAVSLLTRHTGPGQVEPHDMDNALVERASSHDAKVEALETWHDQLVAVDASVSLADLRDAIHARKDINCDLDRMRGAYDASDLDTMTSLLVIPSTAEVLVWARNRAWLPKLEGYLAASEANRGAFVAVGLAHLAGDHGLPAMLAAAGYHVERAAVIR